MTEDTKKPSNLPDNVSTHVEAYYIGRADVGRIEQRLDAATLRMWWHEMLRQHGLYKCYAVLLALPADAELRKYLEHYPDELNDVSGKYCLVLVLGGEGSGIYANEPSKMKLTLDEQIHQGHSLIVADIFDVPLVEFPALLIFKDVRSPDHVRVSLQGMSEEEIVTELRSVFSTIRDAARQDTNPLAALEQQRRVQEMKKQGASVASKLSAFAGKTLESAMDAYMKSVIK
jgi:hypothetical protein